jgi:ATP-dependent Clp protease ATP-binding subunit ClpX
MSEIDFAQAVLGISISTYNRCKRGETKKVKILKNEKELSQEDIKRIITEPKNNILDQYKELFRLDGIELTFNEDALELIYKICYESKLGARGIRSVFEAILKDAMFTSPGKRKKFIVSKTTVKHMLKLSDENFYIKYNNIF